MSVETPSKDLWKSVADARPIIQFAHKFDMQTILQECDTCLSQKAGDADGKVIFQDNDTAVAWAALAEECGLSTLLANAELFMVKNADPEFWQSPVFATHKLSSTCMLRMLRAAQQYMISWSATFAVRAPHADWEQSQCKTCYERVYCRRCCSRSYPDKQPSASHVSLSTLIDWQQSSKGVKSGTA